MHFKQKTYLDFIDWNYTSYYTIVKYILVSLEVGNRKEFTNNENHYIGLPIDEFNLTC